MKVSSNCAENSLFDSCSSRIWNFYLIALFVCVGFLISATQILGESPDYLQYESFFDLVRAEGFYILESSRFERGFSILSLSLTMIFSSNLIVYSWTVAVSMLLKGWVLITTTASSTIFIAIAVYYFLRYFPIHEITQLRAACAAALILVGVIFLWKRNFRYSLLFFAIATLFHTSAVAIIPALFITTSKRSKVLIISLLVYVATSIYAALAAEYLASYIYILDEYQKHGFYNTKPNPFAANLLIDWSMIIASFIMWNRLTTLMKRIIMLELIGMAIFYGSMELGVVAHRVRELYCVFWIFFLADGLRLRSTKLISYSYTLICATFYAYIFLIDEKFFS